MIRERAKINNKTRKIKENDMFKKNNILFILKFS